MKVVKLSLIILLSLLFSTRIAFALAQVESRSSSPWHAQGKHSRSWENDRQIEQQPIQQESPPSLVMQSKLEFLQQEVQELRGKVEEQAYQLQQMQDNQRKLFADLEKRLHENKPAAPTVKANPAEMSESVTEKPAANPVPSPFVNANEKDVLAQEKIYQNAYHLIQNKDYEAALTAFKSLITHYPNGKYLPNAHYWIGEIHLTKGNLSGAAESFEMVVRLYPEHPKAPDSLLKLGYVEYAKGQWKRSKEILSQVKSQYPGSTSAQLADSRLQMMYKEKKI